MAESKPQLRKYPPLLPGEQAGELYGVSRRTMDRWYAEGILPQEARIVVGGSTRYRTAVLMEHIATGMDSDTHKAAADPLTASCDECGMAFTHTGCGREIYCPGCNAWQESDRPCRCPDCKSEQGRASAN